MKTLQINRITFLFILMLGWMTAKGQQQWEVPGDNFSLEGALEIFKKSATPEEFERMLNDPDARVNNLDLNGDGYIDYIRVIDMYERNVHTFVLQAAISEYESQDIAIITLEKLANGRAILQITGDADIYGVETIIEPTTEVRTYAGANRSRVVVNVWSWPMVRYVYGPYYSVWVSPWGWSYRPYWWSPWRPIVYYNYYSFWRPYRWHYSVCFTHRIAYAHSIYHEYRTTSVIVYNKHHHRIKEYRSRYIDRDGHYQARESRYSSRGSNNVRYNPDGRIRSDANVRTSSRTSSVSSINQSRSSARSENGNTIRSTGQDYQRSTGSNNARISTERMNNNSSQRRSVGSSSRQESARISSGNKNMRTSDPNSAYRNSDAGSRKADNYRRSNTSPKVQPSTGGSRDNNNIRRSPQTSRNSSIRTNSSNGSSSRTSSYGRTSGNSGSRISKGTSGNSGSRISKGSSGNSGSRISKGTSGSRNSNTSRSSVQRSSSRSNNTISRSSGRSSNSKRGRDF